MHRVTRKLSLPLVALLACGLTACASSGGGVDVGVVTPDESSVIAVNDIMYEVKPGDSLSNIALATTGDAANWKAIAEHNGIDDPRTLEVGTIISIPRALLSSSNVQALREKKGSNRITQSRPLPVTTDKGLIARQTTNADEHGIVVQPVHVNRTFNLQPIGAHKVSWERATTDKHYVSTAAKIRVLGTYFPIAVYEQPANYAQLVQRVAPGTTFALQSEINDWYKVETDNGVGFIRKSDSAIVR